MAKSIAIKNKDHEKAAKELAAKINYWYNNDDDPYSPSARAYSVSDTWYVELSDFGFESGYNFINGRGLFGGNIDTSKNDSEEPVGPVFDIENSNIMLECWDSCLVRICDK